MTIPFKFLPHEILNKPKPASAIRIYPLWPHEFFIPKPIEKPATPSKPVTTIRARLLSQNQQTTKKGEKKKGDPCKPTSRQNPQINTQSPQTHQPPATKTHHHPRPPPLRTSNHYQSQDLRQAATTLPCFVPPLSSPPSHYHQSSILSASRSPSHRQPFFLLSFVSWVRVSLVQLFEKVHNEKVEFCKSA